MDDERGESDEDCVTGVGRGQRQRDWDEVDGEKQGLGRGTEQSVTGSEDDVGRKERVTRDDERALRGG